MLLMMLLKVSFSLSRRVIADAHEASSSRSRALSQRMRALPWHRGQCLFLHELYEMAVVCPQPMQRSRCPPSAAVRQRVMASRTFSC